MLRLATEAGYMRAPVPVTTTDLLKLAGLTLVLIDHYGLFFDPNADWWRVVGRGAAPVFFFLIGFARTRTVPSLAADRNPSPPGMASRSWMACSWSEMVFSRDQEGLPPASTAQRHRRSL